MTSDKDSGNISRDGLTGLKSKAYFLISLENSINKLALPNPSANTGVVAVYLGSPPNMDLVVVAKLVDEQADYATHYKNGPQEIIAGVYEGGKLSLSEISANLQADIPKRLPNLRFGISHLAVDKDSNAERVLEEVARNAYESMILQKPAV